MSSKSQALEANQELARKLIERSLKPEDRNRQDDLLKTLEYSTVAVRLAISYMKSASRKTGQEMNIDQYLKLYEDKKNNLKIENDSKSRVILVALKLSLNAIRKDKEIGLEAERNCLLIAYLALDKPIPCHLFSSCNRASPKMNKIMKAIELLAKYGIVFYKLGGPKVRIDCSIQGVIKTEFKDSEVTTLEEGLELIAKKNLETEEVHHAMVLWNHASKHEVLVKKYHGLIGKIMNALNRNIRDSELLVQFGKKQLGPLKKHLGPRHEELLKLKNNLSITMEHTGAGGGIVEAHKLCKESTLFVTVIETDHFFYVSFSAW